MFIMKCFYPTLLITKSCCRAVPDDKFEVQIDSTCTIIGFSTSALSRGDRIWRKGTTKFSCSHLVVDISRSWASNCAGKPPVSMRGSVPRYRARKKVWCIGRKQESIFESEAWTYISCSRQNTNSVFGRVLYLRERTATWPGERLLRASFFYFLFSAAVTKTGGWTTSLVLSHYLDYLMQ